MAQHLMVIVPPSNPSLQWQTSVTTVEGNSWLSATPLGSGNGTISVSIDPNGLGPGTYHGTVIVAEAAQPADYTTAAITLIVQPLAYRWRMWLPVVVR